MGDSKSVRWREPFFREYKKSSQRNLVTILTALTLILFLLFLVVASWIGYRENIPMDMISLQVLIGVSYVAMLSIGSRLSINLTLSLSFIYGIVFTFLVRQFHLGYWNNIFPPGDLDGFFYHTIGTRYINNSISELFQNFLKSREIGDWGFILIVYAIYHFFSELSFGQLFLTYIVNPFCIVASSYYLYRTMRLIIRNSIVCRWVLSIFAFYPYFFLVSAVGRKENIFVFFVSICLFYTMRFCIRKSRKDLYLSVIFALIMIFFRPPISAMFLIVIGISLVVKTSNIQILFYVGAVVLVLFPLILGPILEFFFGVSLDRVIAIADARNKGIRGGRLVSWSIQIISAILGPFPTFTKSGIYGIFNSIGLLLKCLFPFFVYRVIPVVLRTSAYYMVPPLLYLFMGGAMMIISGVALDLRYHITFFPALLVLLAYSLDWNSRINKTFILYLSFIIVVILQYNLR